MADTPAPTPAPPPTPPLRLLTTGNFHGDEITARSGEAWLGLFPSASGGFELRRTTLKVAPVKDDPIDKDLETGQKVSTSDAASPLFLVRDIKGLRPRPVQTAFAGELFLEYVRFLRLNLGGNVHMLAVEDAEGSTTPIVDPSGDVALPPKASLLLNSVTIQKLYQGEDVTEGPWVLYWAGDLDGDGKLDLYVSLRHTDRLFLSSAAKKGELVGEVATFEMPGC